MWRLTTLLAGGLLAAVGLALVAPSSAAAPAGAPAWRWPLDPRPEILARFAAPADPYGPGSRGVDLAATAGQPVLAAGAGVVGFAGLVAGVPVVTVDHGTVVTTYEPVLPAAHAGQLLAAGDEIGTVAPLPRLFGSRTCLHWGAYLDGSSPRRYVDPLVLLGAGPARLLPDAVGGRSAADPAPPARVATGADRSSETGAGAARRIPAGPAAAPTAPAAGGGRNTRRVALAAGVVTVVSGAGLLAPVLSRGAGRIGGPRRAATGPRDHRPRRRRRGSGTGPRPRPGPDRSR